MKNVVVRSLSGVIYVAVFVAAILCGYFSYYLLTEVLMVVGVYEFLRLREARTGHVVPQAVYIINIASAILFGSVVMFAFGGISDPGGSLGYMLVFSGVALVPALALLWVGLLFYTTFSRADNAVGCFGDTLMAFAYIVLPLTMIMTVDFVHGIGSTLVLVSLVGIWINDTGAYCVGCTIGKHRLCERLSPKKSWEGFWGGMFFTVVAGAVYAWIAYGTTSMICMYGVYGAVVSLFATVGDLFESRLKRRAGVKDSGNLIPGHGGILDRIDSFLFVAYPIFVMAQILLEF